MDKEKERFMKYVNVTDNGCWEWKSNLAVTGYGNFFFRGKTTTSHRASYLLFKQKDIPPGYLILHSCKTKSCCNPEHLTAGTRQQNNGADRVRDGTSLRGERCHFSKLKLEDVQAIRTASQAGEKRKDIALRYAISLSTVSSIVRGNSWKE